MKLGSIDIAAIMLGGTEITKAYLGSSVVYSAEEPQEDLQHTPFFIENLTNTPGTITYRQGTQTGNFPKTINIQTSTDKNTWNTWVNYTRIPSSETTFTITLPANGRVYFRAYCKFGSNNVYSGFNYIRSNTYYGTPTSSVPSFSTNSFLYCNVSHGIGGNIQSMFYGSSFTGDEIDIRSYSYSSNSSSGYSQAVIGLPRLHSDVSSTDNLLLCSAKKLFIPENLTGNGIGMFMYLFYRCKNLTEINPHIKLNLTNNFSYSGIFSGCENLTTERPIEVVYGNYYNLNQAFYNCSKVDKLIINNTSSLTSTEQGSSYPYKEYDAFSGVSNTGKMIIKNQEYSYYTYSSSYKYGLPGWDKEYPSILDIGQRGNAVNIIDAMNNKPIYYTTDGSTPTTSSTLFTSPFTISNNTNVKAAVQDIFGEYVVSEMECLSNYDNTLYLQPLTNEDSVIKAQCRTTLSGEQTISDSFQYSFDLNTWETVSFSTRGTYGKYTRPYYTTTVTVPKGKRVYIKGNAIVSLDGQYAVGGEITSTSAIPSVSMTSNYGNPQYTSAGNLYVSYVSGNRFNCSFISSLLYGPVLNTSSTYYSMFFYGCSRLKYIKTLKTISMSSSNTGSWTHNLPSTGTFVKPSGMSSTKNASGNRSNPHYIPYDWNIVNI